MNTNKFFLYFLFLHSLFVSCGQQTRNLEHKQTRSDSAVLQINIKHCVYSDDKSKHCKCTIQFELEDSNQLIHVKDQFYKSNTGHLYEKNFALRELNGKLKEYEYFNGYFSQEVDPFTFEPLDGWYAKDKNYVYYYRPVLGGMQIIKIDKADTKSFKLLEGHYKYAMDKNFFYDEPTIIEGFIPSKTILKHDKEGRVTNMTYKDKTYKFEIVE